MLQVTIPGVEYYDEASETFIQTKSQILQLEHSLVSLSKWESKWKKPFLSKEQRPMNESIDYIRHMTLTQNVNPDIYDNIPQSVMEEINRYIDDPMTATWFSNRKKGHSRGEAVTAEVIYYWMISLNIPFECQKWHLNRLITLVEVCSIKNEPPKKMSKRQTLENNRSINSARRKQMNTSG